MEGVVVIVFFAVLAIVIRVLAGGMDHGRVRRYVQGRGGKVLEVRWAPFGPGWFGEKSDRIYEVRYLDRDGSERRAHCKTSWLTGVYFTQDEIVRPADRPAERSASSLDEENRRLREELARLKQERS